jgi:3,4-dihydroxy 2-butanone 4-phosphate synthase / GTP cyclohydrolase II
MKLAAWLTEAAMSQSAFARSLGVTQGRIAQLVAGAMPSLDLAHRIAAATGNRVKPQDFQETPMTAETPLDSVEQAIAAIARGEPPRSPPNRWPSWCATPPASFARR